MTKKRVRLLNKKKHAVKKGFWDVFATPKLTLLLACLVLATAAGFLYTKYQDWENAKTLRAIVVDFETLEKKLEQATGVEMTLKKGCFTTQEKYTSGSTSCYLTIGSDDRVVDKNLLLDVISANSSFKLTSVFEDRQGAIVEYSRPQVRCSISMSSQQNAHFKFECYVERRKSNSKLLDEVLSPY